MGLGSARRLAHFDVTRCSNGSRARTSTCTDDGGYACPAGLGTLDRLGVR